MFFTLNGDSFGHISPQYGLRQGGLLLPNCFLFVGVSLSRMILNAEQESFVYMIKVPRDASPISHLFYANDVLIFSKANATKVKNHQDNLRS